MLLFFLCECFFANINEKSLLNPYELDMGLTSYLIRLEQEEKKRKKQTANHEVIYYPNLFASLSAEFLLEQHDGILNVGNTKVQDGCLAMNIILVLLYF